MAEENPSSISAATSEEQEQLININLIIHSAAAEHHTDAYTKALMTLSVSSVSRTALALSRS